MSQKKKSNPVATYVITAIILAIITYIEFAIIEYEIAWLSSAAILFWLIALSVVKFIMVVAIFMHLKDDELTYTGFFSSGMLLALGTFIVLPILFTVASIPDPIGPEVRAQAAEQTQEAGNGDLSTPPPADRSTQIEAPGAAPADATVRDADSTGGQETGEEAQAQAGEAPADEDAQAVADEGEEAEPAAAGAIDFDREQGEAVYAANCVSCHQGEGQGLPGVFPPLAGHIPDLVNAGGRDYVIDVVLYGLQGPIEVDGQTYNGVMPAWQQLSDDDIAAVVNHMATAWGNEEQLDEFAVVTEEDVAQHRDQDPGDLLERRAALAQ